MIAALLLAGVAALAPIPERTVVAFVPGVAWDAPGTTAGALVPATARESFCPADLALTLSAGRRAALPSCAVPGVRARVVEGWAEIVRANDARHFGARPGTLAETVAAAGDCVASSGPLAALVAADPAGRLADHAPFTHQTDCRLHVVDLTEEPSLEAALAVLRGLTYERLVLLSLRPGHLGAVAVSPGSEDAILRGSTRRAGLVTPADVTAYLAGGSGIANVPGTRADLAELDRREHLHRRYAGVFFTGLIALPGLLCIALMLGWRLPRAGLVLATYPAAGFLASAVPWWRPADYAGAAAVAAIVAAMGVLLAAGLGIARLARAPAEAGVAAASALLFLGDLLTGGYLQETGIASYSALAGGRFYGLGNVGFAVLATSAVVVLGAAAVRRRSVQPWLALPVVIGVVAWHGADFGGAVTLTAVLVVALARRARPVHVALGTAAGLLVALGVAVADSRRADPTHLGRFVDEIADGSWTDTVVRKAEAAASSLATFYPIVVVLTVLAALRVRPRDVALVVPLAVLWTVGSLLNDSGVVVAAAGMAVAGPLMVSRR